MKIFDNGIGNLKRDLIGFTLLRFFCSALICLSPATLMGGNLFSDESDNDEVLAKTPTWQIDQNALLRVSEDIKILSSTEMAGRQPGTPGIQLAEDYLVKQYQEIGLKPLANGTYLQEFEVGRAVRVDTDNCKLIFNGPNSQSVELELGTQWQVLTSRGNYDLDTEVVFVGYGISASEINFDEYDGIDVQDKVVVLIRMEPRTEGENTVFNRETPSRHASGRAKAMAARRAGAAAVIMLNDSATATDDERDELIPSDRFGLMTIPFVQLKRNSFEEILKTSPIRTAEGESLESLALVEQYISENLEPLSQVIDGWTANLKAEFKSGGIKTNNVIGIIEGEGPNANETVVIGGHYDHLGDGAYGSRTPGRREIHHGADDNATGTAAVLELARRYASRDQKPPRRMVFICFSAEEMGLLGAVHYVNNPEYPLEDTVMMFNFDMIGWLRDEKLSVISWNSSPQFSPVLDECSDGFGLEVLKPRSSVGGSDHMPFNSRGIPNLFFHTGLHEVYHTPEDTYDAINCEGALKVIDYSEKVIDRMIEQAKRPTFGPPPPFRLGVTLDEDSEDLLIESVVEESPAAMAGLLAGDIILEIDETVITSRRAMTRKIRMEEGKTVKFKVRRDDAEVILNVTLKNDPAT